MNALQNAFGVPAGRRRVVVRWITMALISCLAVAAAGCGEVEDQCITNCDRPKWAQCALDPRQNC